MQNVYDGFTDDFLTLPSEALTFWVTLSRLRIKKTS